MEAWGVDYLRCSFFGKEENIMKHLLVDFCDFLEGIGVSVHMCACCGYQISPWGERGAILREHRSVGEDSILGIPQGILMDIVFKQVGFVWRKSLGISPSLI